VMPTLIKLVIFIMQDGLMKLLFHMFIRVRTNDCSRPVRIIKDMKDVPSLMQITSKKLTAAASS
jgi:hypothetical protein